MNNRIKNIALICSLIFNITLVGFLAHHHIIGHRLPPLPPHHHVHNDAVMNKRVMIRNKYAEFGETKREFMQMLANPVFHEDSLRIKLDEVIRKQNDLEKTIGENLIEMRKNMTAEEVEKFRYRVKERRERMEETRKIPRRR